MGRETEISVGDRRATIELFDDLAPQTVEQIMKLLPIHVPLCHAKFAGDELMFMIPLVTEAECSKENLEEGDVLYYPIQQTLCLFFSENIQPFGSGPFNTIGRITDGLENLKDLAQTIVRDGFQWADYRGKTQV
jgi:hypothetical protein